MDRIVLGAHANTQLGSGLFVSTPGANVTHPEHGQYGNLMFDTNEPHSSLTIIQTGTFKITCKRKAFSARGEMIGARVGDNFNIKPIVEHQWTILGPRVTSSTLRQAYQPIAFLHTFNESTGRPSAITTQAHEYGRVATWEYGYGWDDPDVTGMDRMFTTGISWNSDTSTFGTLALGTKLGSKQGNYLDTGSHTITINNPLPDGEIPEVALRFAIGNDGTHPLTGAPYSKFHPWYANTKTTGDGGSWSDIDFGAYFPAGTPGFPTSGTANASQIVHMDSNWMRLKWGGLGAEEYRGTQEEFSWARLVDFFGTAEKVANVYGFIDATDAEEKLTKNSKLLSLALTNAQGIVGLIPYVNATSITVDAYMTPTHAGLRQPVDRTFQINAGKQKGIGFNAIDDFAHINFPLETTRHTSFFWKFNDIYGGAAAQNPDIWRQTYPAGPFTSKDNWNDWYWITKQYLHGTLFAELPGVPESAMVGDRNSELSDSPGLFGTRYSNWPGHIFNRPSTWTPADGGHGGPMIGMENPNLPVNEPDHGKRDMFGWGGHPTEFFVNPFSNDTLTFYTHMQPPYGAQSLHQSTINVRYGYETVAEAQYAGYKTTGVEGEDTPATFETTPGGTLAAGVEDPGSTFFRGAPGWDWDVEGPKTGRPSRIWEESDFPGANSVWTGHYLPETFINELAFEYTPWDIEIYSRREAVTASQGATGGVYSRRKVGYPDVNFFDDFYNRDWLPDVPGDPAPFMFPGPQVPDDRIGLYGKTFYLGRNRNPNNDPAGHRVGDTETAQFKDFPKMLSRTEIRDWYKSVTTGPIRNPWDFAEGDPDVLEYFDLDGPYFVPYETFDASVIDSIDVDPPDGPDSLRPLHSQD